jgi:hypothetical protein
MLPTLLAGLGTLMNVEKAPHPGAEGLGQLVLLVLGVAAVTLEIQLQAV